jgi:hypothetical protein
MRVPVYEMRRAPVRRGGGRPEVMKGFSPGEGRKVYVILDLTVEALADGDLKTGGAFGEEPVWADVGT